MQSRFVTEKRATPSTIDGHSLVGTINLIDYIIKMNNKKIEEKILKEVYSIKNAQEFEEINAKRLESEPVENWEYEEFKLKKAISITIKEKDAEIDRRLDENVMESIKQLDDNHMLKVMGLMKVDTIKKAIDEVDKYELALTKIQRTHSKINWSRIFLLRLKKELKQKLGVK